MIDIASVSFPDGLDMSVLAVLPTALPELVVSGAPGGVLLEDARARVTRGGLESARRDCLLAGLWLLEGELDRAHRLCQEVPTALGSAWHGVVHRMEGDFWNSKYWWRRAGGVKCGGMDEVLQKIIAAAPAEIGGEMLALGRGYDSARFVDVVEAHANATGKVREILLDVQRWEWAALYLETWERG